MLDILSPCFAALSNNLSMPPTPELLVSGLVGLSIYEKRHLKGLPDPLVIVLHLPRNVKH